MNELREVDIFGCGGREVFETETSNYVDVADKPVDDGASTCRIGFRTSPPSNKYTRLTALNS